MSQLRLPDFLIIGAMRCGTSSTGQTLSLHPDIYLPNTPSLRPQHKGDRMMEVHFFENPERWARGFGWYKQQFAKTGSRLAGDKTPRYVASEVAMRRIARHMPHVPMILLLRDPVTRLWSQYRHHSKLWWRRKNPISFSKFLDSSGGRGWTIGRGYYGDQVERLLKLFSREQIHIEFTEKSANKPRLAIRRMHEFLGVAPGPTGPAGRARLAKYKPMPEKQVQRFRKHYREQMEKLYDLLGDEHIKTWM